VRPRRETAAAMQANAAHVAAAVQGLIELPAVLFAPAPPADSPEAAAAAAPVAGSPGATQVAGAVAAAVSGARSADRTIARFQLRRGWLTAVAALSFVPLLLLDAKRRLQEAARAAGDGVDQDALTVVLSSPEPERAELRAQLDAARQGLRLLQQLSREQAPYAMHRCDVEYRWLILCL
jgi:hypothetical protein